LTHLAAAIAAASVTEATGVATVAHPLLEVPTGLVPAAAALAAAEAALAAALSEVSTYENNGRTLHRGGSAHLATIVLSGHAAGDALGTVLALALIVNGICGRHRVERIATKAPRDPAGLQSAEESHTILDGVSLVEAVAVSDAGEMAEHVFAAIIGSDETESAI